MAAGAAATLQYVYRVAEVVKVTDGDTYWLRVDVGFRELVLVDVRLLGYDAPELHSTNANERVRAVDAQVLASTFLVAGTSARDLWIRTEKDPDSFGRWLGDLWREIPLDDGVVVRHLGAALRENDLATLWPTRWHDEFGS